MALPVVGRFNWVGGRKQAAGLHVPHAPPKNMFSFRVGPRSVSGIVCSCRRGAGRPFSPELFC